MSAIKIQIFIKGISDYFIVPLFLFLTLGCQSTSQENSILLTTNFTESSSITEKAEKTDNILLTRNDQMYANKVIVFVHGYTGSPEKTWGKFPQLIMEDKDLKEFDIFLWGYPTKLISKNPTVENLGKYLKSELNIRLKKYQKIFLIGHSLGGLIIQSMIVNELIAGHASHLKRIKRIILFGTPNTGEQIPNIVRLFDQQLYDLHTTSRAIHKIRREWTLRVQNPEINPGDENSKYHIPVIAVIGIEDQWVDPKSAEGFFEEVEIVPGDHNTMKEPLHSGASVFILVKQNCLPSFSTSQPSPKILVPDRKLAEDTSALESNIEINLHGQPVRGSARAIAEIILEMGRGIISIVE